MHPDIFAEWLRRQGHRVIRTVSSYWFDQGPRVYQAFPFHWAIQPSEQELQELLRRVKGVGLRFSTPLDAPSGHVSYHVVYEEPVYEVMQLPKKARHDIQHGLDYAVVEPISFQRLATEGWGLRRETLQRQGRERAESEEWWAQLCLTADGLPGLETWGAIHEGMLVAAVLTIRVDDCCCILYQQSSTAHLKYGVNNALTFVFTQDALSRPGIRRVFYGLHSLDAPASVDEYKFRMGYTAKPVRQRVVFHPWLAPLFNRGTHSLVKRLRRWRPASPMLAKTEGMLRFYLEGKRPLEQQMWPEALTRDKQI